VISRAAGSIKRAFQEKETKYGTEKEGLHLKQWLLRTELRKTGEDFMEYYTTLLYGNMSAHADLHLPSLPTGSDIPVNPVPVAATNVRSPSQSFVQPHENVC
jgi:hypothetical protein